MYSHSVCVYVYRFVVKMISSVELHMFLDFAPAYFGKTPSLQRIILYCTLIYR